MGRFTGAAGLAFELELDGCRRAVFTSISRHLLGLVDWIRSGFHLLTFDTHGVLFRLACEVEAFRVRNLSYTSDDFDVGGCELGLFK